MSISLEVDVSTTDIDAFVRTVMSDQLPFAIASAVSRTALDFQKAERARLHELRRSVVCGPTLTQPPPGA